MLRKGIISFIAKILGVKLSFPEKSSLLNINTSEIPATVMKFSFLEHPSNLLIEENLKKFISHGIATKLAGFIANDSENLMHTVKTTYTAEGKFRRHDITLEFIIVKPEIHNRKNYIDYDEECF